MESEEKPEKWVGEICPDMMQITHVRQPTREELDEERDEWIKSHFKIWDCGSGIKVKSRVSRFIDTGEGFAVCNMLACIGVPVLIQSVKDRDQTEVTALVPESSYPITRKLTRNAGRRSNRARFGACPEINSETTVAEFLDWQKSHTPEQCAAALGMPRSTYYRAMKKIKAAPADWKLNLAIESRI